MALPVMVVALDTGGTTGFAAGTIGGYEVALSGFQIPGKEHHNDLYSILELHRPEIIVSESFSFRQHRNNGGGVKDKVDLTACEYIGVAKLYAKQHDIRYAEQQPSHAFHFITDEKLRSLGVFRKKTADRHYHDAMRHLLYYMCVNLKIKEPITNRWL